MLTDCATIVRVTDHYCTVISGVENEVKERMKNFPPCHDWWHIMRVRKLGRHLAAVEGADSYIVDLALLCHDIGDRKVSSDGRPSWDIAREILKRHETHSSVVIEQVCSIIYSMARCNRVAIGPMPTLDGAVAQDADILDAMGVIGIARAFTTGAMMKQVFYTPGEQPRRPEEMLIRSMGPPSTIAHFHEKLLLLKDRMNTKEGKRLAKRRHTALAKFVHQFHQEWDLEL